MIVGNTDHQAAHVPPLTLTRMDQLVGELGRALAGKRAAVFLDYDGTLTPIVDDPARANLSAGMRDAVRALARCCPVAIVSGRDRRDVTRRVGIDGLFYAGSHGFDIVGPGRHLQHQAARAALPALDAAERALRRRLGSIHGALTERKRFSVAAHYRMVAPGEVTSLARAVDEVLAAHPGLRRREGKKVLELQPDVAWDKGRAVLWLLAALDLDSADVVPTYVGDDLTDEDAFRALADRGITVLVCGPDLQGAPRSHAHHRLRDPAEVERFLRALAGLLS